MAKTRTLASWSGGKDAAWTLHQLLQSNDIEVAGLFTTVNAEFQRVCMHATPVPVLKAQAEAIGLPLKVIEIPHPCPNATYAATMSDFLEDVKSNDIQAIAFGDLFLEDVRDYRVTQMKGTGIEPVFPSWGTPTEELAKLLIENGFKMIVTSVDPRQIPKRLAGRPYNEDFLSELPESADPCGENGEFHTFVHDGPMFKHPLNARVGEIVERDGFVFADVKIS